MIEKTSKIQHRCTAQEKSTWKKRVDNAIDTGKDAKKCEGERSDDEYWEEMLFLSLGQRKWNIGCGCG